MSLPESLREHDTLLVFGGSFDPPHVAHVLLPMLAAEEIGAAAVAYVPCATQPLKQHLRQTPAHHRLAMLRLALAPEPRALVLTDEIDRAGNGTPSYTVDTLETLRGRLRCRLRMLIGADQLLQLDCWKDWARVIELAEPVVMVRPPWTAEALLAAVPLALADQPWRQRLVAAPQIEVSSTQLRTRLEQGRSPLGWVTPAVADYIARQGLYDSGNHR